MLCGDFVSVFALVLFLFFYGERVQGICWGPFPAELYFVEHVMPMIPAISGDLWLTKLASLSSFLQAVLL